MITINNKSFEFYQDVCGEIRDILVKHGINNQLYIDIIYHILMGFPVRINDAGEYVYSDKHYKTVQSLPKCAKLDLIAMMDSHSAAIKSYRSSELRKLIGMETNQGLYDD